LPRYHFQDFVLSPRRRLLLRDGKELSLIPRYFDLLVFLVERRHEAVHRRDIFERVWSDANVSDSALSQAIRTIRVVLDDDSKEPRFIRTVSRHGYQFVFNDVREEEEEDGAPPPAISADRRLAGGAHWVDAALGGGLAGLIAGAVGGLLLAAIPGSAASFALVPVLALIGAACGAAGGAGVGAGISVAEARFLSQRVLADLVGGAIGGGIVGTAAEFLGRWSLAALVGVHIDIGGSVEGLSIGAAAGLATGLTTSSTRLRAAVVTAAFCGAAGLVLTRFGLPLVGGTIHAIATGSGGTQAVLTPLGRLIGEPGFGPVSRAIIGTGEALVFGLGFALGLRRHFSPTSHALLTER
jgi:DNA-binding winged helix-turn-helix (wHTH) protein